MLKVEIFFIILILVPLTLTAVVSRDLMNQQNRRIEFFTKNDFLDNLYNKNGKKHELGADYGLTSNVYRKPNPFYTKTTDQTEDDGKKFWYPVYNQNQNHSDTPDVTGSSSKSSETFNPAHLSYDAKTNTYSSYNSPPPSHYGAPPLPAPTYLPLPSPMPTYGPPGYTSSYYVPHQTYGSPSIYPSTVSSHEDKKSHESWFLEKILKKFDLVLMSKLLLKFIIFKKIVKFIGIICLLLFIPALKKKFEDVAENMSSDEERNGRNYKFLDAYASTDFRIKEIANFALTAIEGFESHQIPWCVGESEFYCRFQYMLDQVDLRYPLFRLPGIWFPAFTTTTTSAPPSSATRIDDKKEEINYNDLITETSDSSSIEESVES